MRILLSALSCNPRFGSEALVGYKYAETIAQLHSLAVIASPPAEVPSGTALHAVEAGPCNFNEVAARPLWRFEMGQLPKAFALNRRQPFDFVHRVTPSWIGNPTLLQATGVPLIIGPILGSSAPVPDSFAPYLRRTLKVPNGTKVSAGNAVLNRLAIRGRNMLSSSQLHLRCAHKILIGTPHTLNDIPLQLHGKCEYITYSGVEHQQFLPPGLRRANGSVNLLYVGRLVQYKGIELLLRAVALVKRQCRVRLRVAGTGCGSYVAFCQQLVNELGLNEDVGFIGALPRYALTRLYQEADIFCFPSVCDTYGVALLEAMSSQCAVVASNASGPHQIVADSTGMTVPISSPDQFIQEYANAIVRLAADRDLREELGLRARQHVLKNHDWDMIARQLLRIYSKL
jgi:glycosyltransferase involved in cell wall biosynthesis